MTPTDEQIAAQKAGLDAGLKSVGEGIAKLKAEKGLLTRAARDLLALIERNSEGQAGPFAIRNCIANSAEFDALKRLSHGRDT